MVDDGIPAELRDFIAKSIDSVAQLEALLLLRANPETSWDVVQLARRLYVNEAEAARHPSVADFRSHDTFADGAVADA